jgi:high-affinity Fe2+/Pb2+ permease
MDDERINRLEEKLEETREIVERNNEKINQAYNMLWRGRMFQIVYYLLIVGVAIGAFYFLEPYIDNAVEVYGQLQERINSFPLLDSEAGSTSQ